ncbi:RNA polymerase II elongation factor Ell isoform X2 [Ochlerotatus camptorhynchus]|uniref:RNA polymerase II elongation factor Ell isoform X2 n=1 Tax=Ochlerotatus camptorhynchus TaxID=644619 RepID=UPI0031D38E96
MAALCAGSYGLSQQHQPQNTNDNKERIFVKLTDSALRAIEEFQRNQLKLGSTLNPSIQFVNGGEGYLSFPSSGNNVQKFSFSISDIDGGGSIECIQQNQGQQLQNMGHIQHKMRIHANDDVYERTRHRMAAVEETQKNKCTREIKPNQTDIGRKVKLKNTTTRISNIPSSNSVLSKRDSLHSSSNNYSSNNNNNNNNNNSNHNNNHNGSSNAVVNSSSSLLNPALASNNQHHQQQQQQQHQNHNGGLLSSSAVAAATANNNGNNYNNQHLSTSPKLPKSNGLHNNHHYSNGSSNNNQSAQPKPGYQHTVHDPPHQQQQQQQKSETNGVVSSRTANGRASKDTGNPNLMKRNIKERLIHLLALRPYKKPEIFARIQQDGVRREERKCITQILTNISSMRDNVYYLHRHIWNDVQEDWPFYSEQERQILKRRKPQNLTPPLSSDGGSSTSGQSPSSTHNGSSPPSGGKRSSIANNEEPGVGSAPTSKKPRISHYKKEALPDTNRSSVTPNAQESEDSGVSLSYSLVSNDVARRIQHPAKDEKDRDDVISERDNYDDQINAYRANTNKVKSLKDDFSDQFTRITSVEQRRKYKTEFDNDFQEYRRLHEIVERVSRKFAQLEENLQHERHNERRYKEIQRQIIKEYDESIKDNKFQETKQRFNYLHNKLSHIKHLVHDYDVAITNGHCRPQENY